MQRYIITTYHGEGQTLWYIIDTTGDVEYHGDTVVANYSSKVDTYSYVRLLVEQMNRTNG